MIATKDDYKRYLYEADKNYQGQKTWEQAFLDISTNQERALSQNTYDYSAIMNDAYQQAYLNEQNIRNSSLLGSAKQTLIDENTAALEQAFASYSQQQANAAATINANAQELNTSLNALLEERAGNFKAFDDAHYDYLTRLYEEYGDTELFTNPDNKFGADFSMYLTNERDPITGEVILDSNDNPVKRLMTKDELYNVRLDENGEYLSFHNEKGELTARGADFYDKIENAIRADSNLLTFDNYLRETNEDLFNWANENDAYNYAASNMASFQGIFGADRNGDIDYSFAERLGGLTKGELGAKFEKFTNFAKEYAKTIKKTNGTGSAKAKAELAVNMSNEIKTLTDNLGITDDIEKELGTSLDDYVNRISDSYNKMSSGGDQAFDYLSKTLIPAGAGFVGATTLTLNPIVGLYTAIIAGSSGAAFAQMDLDEQKRINERSEQQIQNAYNQLVEQLVTYAYNKKASIDANY